MTWKLFLHFLENYPTALPYYLIANDRIHALIHDDGHPSHGEGSNIHKDVHSRSYNSRSYKDNYNILSYIHQP